MLKRLEFAAVAVALYTGYAIATYMATKQSNKFRAEDRAYASALTKEVNTKISDAKSEAVRTNDLIESLASQIKTLHNEIATATGGVGIAIDKLQGSLDEHLAANKVAITVDPDVHTPEYGPLPPDVETKIIRK